MFVLLWRNNAVIYSRAFFPGYLLIGREHDVAKYVIVNADDLGIARSTNLAIRRAFREGIVTSASLMANMAAFQHALDHVVYQNPGLGIGIHLCLTSGKPVLPPCQVPLLVDRKGYYCRGFLGLYRLVRSRHRYEAVAQITAELNAQAEQLDRCGIDVDHVDGHQHTHMIPEIFAICAQIATARQAAIRIPDEHFRPSHRWPPRWLRCLLNGGLLKQATLHRLSQKARREAIDLVHPDHYHGVLETGQITTAILWEILRALPDGVTEITCHPGLDGTLDRTVVCSLADRRFLASGNRAAELAAVLDSSFCGDLLGVGITLARFRDILPRHNAAPLRKAA
jgi:predicted glycoside hydrolase/deacetylase ChbG (UPF0249 family)